MVTHWTPERCEHCRCFGHDCSRKNEVTKEAHSSEKEETQENKTHHAEATAMPSKNETPCLIEPIEEDLVVPPINSKPATTSVEF